MKVDRVPLLVCVILVFTCVGFAGSLAITNSDFSAVPIACPGYAYQSNVDDCGGSPPQQNFNGTPGFGWTIGPYNVGLTNSNGFNSPPFIGLPFSQALFLQNAQPSAYQAIAGFSAGFNYMLSFYLGSRYYDNGTIDGNQTVQAKVDGNLLGTWVLTSFTPFTLENVSFSVSTGGIHTLEFDGITPGDHTAFLSGVSITPTATPEPASMILVGTGVLGLAGVLRRNVNL